MILMLVLLYWQRNVQFFFSEIALLCVLQKGNIVLSLERLTLS